MSCPCVFCWPREAIENEGGQPIFEVNVQVIPNLWKVSQNDQTVHSCASLLSCCLCVNLMGWAPQKTKCTHKIKCWGLTHFIFRFFFKKGAPAPSFYLGTSMENACREPWRPHCGFLSSCKSFLPQWIFRTYPEAGWWVVSNGNW